MDWFTYQHALVIGGHQILLEPLMHPDAAAKMRALGPGEEGTPALHELHPAGPVRVRTDNGRSIIECEVDDRSLVEVAGVWTQSSRRLHIAVVTDEQGTQILDFSVGSPGAR